MIPTIFLDIDGTLVKHAESYQESFSAPEIPGAASFTMDLHRSGCRIILTTGRPEHDRDVTESQLRRLGIIYDQLVMGCGCGPRYLINDSPLESASKAISICVRRNKADFANIRDVIFEREKIDQPLD